MAVIQISQIKHRRGLRIDLPDTLNDAEFGWTEDTRELYIGNGPFHDGNSQILTQWSPATIPPYTYISNSGQIANTGLDPFGDPSFPDPNFDTIRNYQEKFDDFVNVRDYGAKGDFDFNNPGASADDTGAILRAMRDIYDESFNDTIRRRRAIYFPAGVYRISQALPLYPYSHIIGDGKKRTIIYLDRNLDIDPTITFNTGNDCVARTVDSQGNSGLNIFSSDAIWTPQNIKVVGVTFRSNADQVLDPTFTGGPVPINGSVREIVKLDLARDVRFENVEFRGAWDLPFDGINGQPTIDGSIAVLISRVGDALATMKNYSFVGCEFRNTAYAFNVLDTIENVLVHNSTFTNHFRAVKLGFDPLQDNTSGTIGSPKLFRVTHNRFQEIFDIAFDVRDPLTFGPTDGLGNISSYNHYTTNNVDPAIRFDVATRSCVSLGDTFDEAGSPIDCNPLTNLRVQNLSDTPPEGNRNVVMNAQDRFQIPNGFCGELVIDGDLTVLGNINITGSIVNISTPFSPFATTTITTIPFSDGNAIIFEYAFTQAKAGPGSYHRIGVMRIIHDDIPTTGTIDFTDTFNELNGPPDNPISLAAVIAGSDVLIQFTTVGATPVFAFNTRVLDTIA